VRPEPIAVASKKDRGAAREGEETPAKEAPPVPVFVSSGAADAVTARELRELLSARGLEVLSIDSASSDLPVERAAEALIRRSKGVVFVLSGRPSLWTQLEIQAALDHRIPNLFVVAIGADVAAPPALEGAPLLRPGTPEDLPAVAEAIAERVRAG
jgi:hypothetical protein